MVTRAVIGGLPRDEVEGSGIGLALVKRLVEMRGGTVQMESAPGEGATFRFTIPRQNAESAPARVVVVSPWTMTAAGSLLIGVGATKRVSAVRWGVAGNIATAWVLTIPMAALVAAVSYWLLHALIGL